MPEDDDDVDWYIDKHNSYSSYVGTARVAYDYLEGDLDYTIIGLQQNGQLVKAPELDMLSVHKGTMTANDLLAYNESTTKTTVIGTVSIAVVLAGVGILLIVLPSKAAPAAKKKSTKRV